MRVVHSLCVSCGNQASVWFGVRVRVCVRACAPVGACATRARVCVRDACAIARSTIPHRDSCNLFLESSLCDVVHIVGWWFPLGKPVLFPSSDRRPRRTVRGFGPSGVTAADVVPCHMASADTGSHRTRNCQVPCPDQRTARTNVVIRACCAGVVTVGRE